MRDILSNAMLLRRDRIAVIDKGISYTYDAILADVESLHRRVRHLSGNHILVLAERSYASVALYAYSVVKGCTLAPVSPNIDRRSLDRLLTELPVKFIYADRSATAQRPFVQTSGYPVLVNDSDGELAACSLLPAAADRGRSASPEDSRCPDLYLIFTSGSTGNPKGVKVSERHLLAYLQGVQQAFGLAGTDVISHISPLTFDFSIHEIFLALFNGATVAVLRENDKFRFTEYLTRNRVTVWSSVPSTLGYMIKTRQLKPGQYPDLRLAFVGGEPVSVDYLRAFAQAAPNATIYSYYGPTECTVAMMACRFQPQFDYGQYMPLGESFGGHRMLLKSADQPLREQGTGEAYIAGPQVLSQYWNNPGQSAARFSHHPEYGYLFKTGDIVSRDEHGVYHFMGREDDDIKIGGYRFDTVACRQFIKEISRADEVLVTAARRGPGSELQELLVITANSALSSGQLARLFRDSYDNYIQPRFYNVAAFPRNANGKIDKKKLLERFAR